MGQAVSKHDVVQDFELKKYLGTWYEIAKYDNWFERGCEDVTAQYTLDPKDPTGIQVTNICPNLDKKSVGRAVFQYPNEKNIGQLQVSFIPMIWSNYNILALYKGDRMNGPYQISLVSGDQLANGKYKSFWILSRNKTFNEQQKQWVRKQIDDLDIDVDRLSF